VRKPLVARQLTVLAVLLGGAAALAQPAAAPEEARLVAIGDVHGAFDELAALLQRTALVDANLDWRGGSSRLVLLGDVLDRGAGSRRALELVMQLQGEAAQAGGEAELVLGNHEVMNLLGDLRYVSAAELEAYRADERPDDREAAWQRFRAAAPERDAALLAEDFAKRYPPGFFGHRAAFGPRGKLGAWLLERPVLLVRERTALVHGGLPASLEGRTVDDINRAARDAIVSYARAVETLIDAGVVYPETEFGEHGVIAARVLAERGAELPAAVRAAAEQLRVAAASPQLGPDAVFWYRGTAACSPAIEQARLAEVLDELDADRVVIGHTPTSDGRVQSRFDGQVLRADTGMLTAVYRGRAAAVVVRDGDVSAVYADGERAPRAQPRSVGPRALGLGDDELERWLATAEIAAAAPGLDGAERVTLERGGERIEAVFSPARRGAGTLPEVAAYRLDRVLGLDLVPVAVRRDVGGRPGALSLPLDGLPSERDRRRQNGVDAWCPLVEQFNLMYAFDALAHHDARSPESVRYGEGLQLALTENTAAFGTRTDRPEHLRGVVIDVPPDLRARLSSLTPDVLDERLGDVLDQRQRAAILTRRDRLLAP
jgi:hypothetical protein